MIVAVFWDIAQCSPNANRRFEGTYQLHLQGRKSAEQETSVRQVDITLNQTNNKLRGLTPRANYSDRCLATVSANFCG
jgi:hypothetical protein